MKKSEGMGYLVYGLMLVMALLVGFLLIRPEVNGVSFPIHPILLVIIALVIGIVLTALLIELGHLLGAKMCHYSIDSWICLGLGFKKGKDGKMHGTFGSFDGLTGETKIVPSDVKKNNPRMMIFIPLIFILLEVVVFVILMVVSSSMVNKTGDAGQGWLKVASEVALTVSCMILLYDIFPASLDAKNDGYLLTILNNKTNAMAYNEMLLAEHNLAYGIPFEATTIYKEVTEFTASVNDVALYAALDKGDFEKAKEIVAYTILSKEHVSASRYKAAMAETIALDIWTKPLEEAKTYFIALPLEQKKSIAALGSASAIRAYVLANGLIEGSYSETIAALEKSTSLLPKLPKEKKIVEKKLLREAMDKIMAAHPDWDFTEFGYGVKKEAEAPKDENKDEKK